MVIEQVTFAAQLRARWQTHSTLVCVGLDPDPERLPACLSGQFDAIPRFCRLIVDACAPYVCAFKPQAAHFAALGQEDQLAELIGYIHENHPGIPVILDAKRGDIGATARLYAREAYERYAADAVTLNPYVGYESIAPYLEHTEKGVFVLCRTSNPGSAWLQNHPPDDPVYLRVAREAVGWNTAGNVMLVAGATYPEDLALIRAAVGTMPLLVPGIGAQGGDLTRVLDAAADDSQQGVIINVSRSVLYASADDDFAAAAGAAACALRDDIRAHTRALGARRVPQ